MDERPGRRAVVLPVLGVIALWTLVAMLAIGLGADNWWAAAIFMLTESGMLLGLAALGRRVGWPAGRLFGRRPSISALSAAISISIPLLALQLGLIWLVLVGLSRIAPEIADTILRIAESDLFESLDAGIAATFFQGLFLCVLVPITEELAFRGLLLHRFAERWGTRRAIILSSVLFAILHLDPLGKFFFAVVCCLVYLETRSLWAPIALHGANNLFALVSPDLQALGGVPSLAASRTEWLAGLAILTVGLVWAVYYGLASRHLWRRLPPGLEDAGYHAPTIEDQMGRPKNST